MLLSRRSFLASGVAMPLASAAWPTLIEPNILHVRHLPLRLPRWPAGHGVLRIAFLTDLHVGCPSVSLDRAAEIVDRANAERPDLIVLGGDYMSGPQTVRGGRIVPPEDIARVLGGLRAPRGVFSVLGNHDWYFDGRRVWRALEAAGIAVLENESVAIKGGAPLWLAGLADSSTRKPDAERALAGISEDAPCLTLAHDPAIFANLDRRPVLTLCGHTHGGQIRLPFYGPLKNASKAPLRWSYGHIVEQDRHMLVSAGIGTSLYPVRFNAPPEIMVVEIGPGAATS